MSEKESKTLEKEKKKKKNPSFSEWDIKEVFNFFGFSWETKKESLFPTIKLENDLSNTIKSKIHDESIYLQTPIGGGKNEATQKYFIDTILKTVFFHLKLYETLHLEPEFTLKGKDTQGRAEYAYVANSQNQIPIVLLVEAKKDDFRQGRAQCYMELFTAGQMNIETSQDYNFPLFGIITNSLSWIFVRYNPKIYDSQIKSQNKELFVESQTLLIEKDSDLTKIIELLVGIFTEQVQKIRDLKVEIKNFQENY